LIALPTATTKETTKYFLIINAQWSHRLSACPNAADYSYPSSRSIYVATYPSETDETRCYPLEYYS
jgi:hypothetical protein